MSTWFVETESGFRQDFTSYDLAKATFTSLLETRILGHYVEGIGKQMWERTKAAIEAAECKELKMSCASWFVKLDDYTRTEGAELPA